MNSSAKHIPTIRKILIFTIWFLCLAANVYVTNAAPYRPANDNTVLARLPVTGDQALRQLRARWKADPDNAPIAVALARRYLRLERAEGDPRYLGYAQAVLRPWWADKQANVPIAVTRAQLLSRRHAFDAALADLDGVLRIRPHHTQALLSRAFILQSQGKVKAAQASCRQLHRRHRSLVSATCLARMESLGGQNARADRRLTAALKNYPGDDPGVRQWALTNLAEIAWRRGDLSRADRLFRDALSLGRRDTYLRDAYADLLLDLKRPAEVLRLFQSENRTDGHLLRLALAARAAGDAMATRYTENLASRFDENRRRGEALPLREEARFELSLRHRPAMALALALQNWRTQREPADARLVLEAALAAGKPGETGAVLAWLRQTGLEDRSLTTLASQIGKTVR
jgi:Tfp pilus assembly protein PilF